jgi:predicted metal-binding protein
MRDELKLTHDRSNLVCSQMKQIVKNDAKLSPKDLKALKDHLLGLNQGQSFESEYQPMKVLVLIDCTGSMSMTLQKTKNCVEKMI